MRDRHVPGGIILTQEDLNDALALIPSVISFLCAALGIEEGRRLQIESLIRADLSTYLAPALCSAGTPKVAGVKELANAAGIGRSTLNKHLKRLTTDLEDCALGLPMLLHARGDFVARSFWQVVEVYSPVGSGATSPGIIGGSQVYWGLALGGADVTLPANLKAPLHLDEQRATRDIAEQIKRIAATADQLSVYALRDERRLDDAEIELERLATYRPPNVLLARDLHLAERGVHADWGRPVRPNAAALWESVQSYGIERIVIESDADPLLEPNAWDAITPEQLLQLLGLAMQMRLDTGVVPSTVTYLLRSDGLIVHRHCEYGTADDGTGGAKSMSFDVAGFDDPQNPFRARSDVVGYIEYLATSETPTRCLERFGRCLAPALIKAANGRPLLCALRMIANDLLVCAARRREAASPLPR